MSDRSILGHAVEGPVDGEPVLLLNGGMMSYAAWEPISSRLAERYRVLLCDFRGQLRSLGASPATLDGHVDDLVAVLDHLGDPVPHVLGTSFGAAVGLLLAARHPERVRSLALVTAMDRVTEAMRTDTAKLRALVAEILGGGGLDRFLDSLVGEIYSAAYRREHATVLAGRSKRFELLPRAWFEGLDGLLAALQEAQLEGAAERVACPALVVLARDDRVIAPERSRALAAAIAGAELIEHPTSGHALVAEDPRWLVDVYLDFLERRREPRAPDGEVG